jgi:hypothetical protein
VDKAHHQGGNCDLRNEYGRKDLVEYKDKDKKATWFHNGQEAPSVYACNDRLLHRKWLLNKEGIYLYDTYLGIDACHKTKIDRT